MIVSFDKFYRSINEGAFDWLMGRSTTDEEQPKNKDASQTDVQDAEIEAFYKTLQEFADSKQAIPVETLGSMKYSKTVENIQAALSFLGYPLPKHGVDGYFGPETANAILKFNDETIAKNTQDSNGEDQPN